MPYYGIVRAAICIDMESDEYNSYAIEAEGFHGILPDLDLVEALRREVSSETQFYRYDTEFSIANSSVLKQVSEFLTILCQTFYDLTHDLFQSLGLSLFKIK